MFSQDDPTPDRLENSDQKQDLSEQAAEAASQPAPRAAVDVLGNRLKFSTTWVEEPVIEHQARLYPDAVKVISERYRVFDLSSEADMEEYSRLRLSHSNHAKFRITSEELMQWSDAKGTWLVAFRVQERLFKTHLTSNQIPDESV